MENQSLKDINRLQEEIMVVVDEWVHQENTPIPLQEILKQMKQAGAKSYTVVNAVSVLLRKGYIRRAVTRSNKTYYVQLRRV